MTALELVHELWNERQHACPYLAHDEQGCYCRSPTFPQLGDRYMPCDYASMQIYCLDGDHYTRCHFWPAGDTP
jgi:hypothetical protein